MKDYISEEESWQTHNFLLRDSKINSVLKLSCHLKLIRGTYNDFDISYGMTSNQMPATLPKLYENKTHISEKLKEKQDLERFQRNSKVSPQDSIPNAITNEVNDDENACGIPMNTKEKNKKIFMPWTF